MGGITIDNIKYIYIRDNDNDLKFTSLTDNVYFTLSDIFWNCEDSRIMDLANELTKKMDEIEIYEDATYLKELYNFLSKLKDSDFYFENKKEDDEVYLEFDIWYKQLQELIKTVAKNLSYLQ